MPKKRSSDKEQEVLGQIFDFIFKEAKKKPEKRKPVKVSGLNGKSMLMDGLTAALERPGAFLTEQAAKDLNDSLDITLLKILPNQSDPTAPVKISASNMVDLIRDPMGVLQKAKDRADANRKSGKAAFVGSVMREFVTNGWARKYADIDTQQAVRLGLTSQGIGKFNEAWYTRSAIGQAATGKGDNKSNEIVSMMNRGANIIGRNVFSESKWNSFSQEERDKLSTIFGLAQGIKDTQDVAYVSARLKKELELQKQNPQAVQQALDKYKEVIDSIRGKGDKISLADSGFYRSAELYNIENRISSLKAGVPGLSSQEITNQIYTLEKTKLILNGQDPLNKAKDFSAARVYIDKEIAGVSSAIRTETDANKREELKRRLKELRGDSRELNSINFWNRVGQAEGYWGAIQNITNGNFVTSILNGDFYDPRKNDMAPSTEEKLFNVGFFAPITEFKDWKGDVKKNPIMGGYNKAMTQIYYMTPRAWMRTLLFNGEGFAYLLYQKKANLGIDLDDDKIRALMGKDSQKMIDSLIKSLSPQDRARVTASLKAIVTLGKLHEFFSFNARLKDKIGKSIEAFMAKRRGLLVDKLMGSAAFKKFFSGAAGELLGQWVKKGGLQNIARALVIGIANAMGFATTGGLANILITVVAGVVSDALFAIGKVLFGIVIFAFLGIIGMFFWATTNQNTFNRQNYTYANTSPDDVVVNPEYYIDDNFIITGGDPGAPGTVYTGNAQQIFNSVRSEMGLSTQLRLVDCSPTGPASDKAACALIDWAWCYSGTQVFCKADKIAKASDAGLTNLFRHELVHQIQHGGSSLIREWGADFLSNNGGGYSFNTRYGVQRATATTSYLLGTGFCSMSQLQKIAVGDGLSTPCGAAVSSFLLGFAVRK